jgi:hypothetical protein
VITSISLSIIASRRTPSSVLGTVKPSQTQSQPAQPPAQAPPQQSQPAEAQPQQK